MTAQPQDHQPAKTAAFKFTDKDGKKHTLPSAAKGRAALSGRDLRDAALGGEQGMISYMIKTLEASKPSETALNALYDLPQMDMVEIVKDWANHGDGDGASLGE